jgi:hypothetical protein
MVTIARYFLSLLRVSAASNSRAANIKPANRGLFIAQNWSVGTYLPPMMIMPIQEKINIYISTSISYFLVFLQLQIATQFQVRHPNETRKLRIRQWLRLSTLYKYLHKLIFVGLSPTASVKYPIWNPDAPPRIILRKL